MSIRKRTRQGETSPLSVFEERAIGDIAVALFDVKVESATLEEQIESTAALLKCTPAQLIAYYVAGRGYINVFSHTPRTQTQPFNELVFDLDYARSCLKAGFAESSSCRIHFA